MKTRITIMVLGLFLLFGFKAKNEKVHIITVYQVGNKYVLEINNALSDNEVCNLLNDLHVNKCKIGL